MRGIGIATISNKERMKILRQSMPEQDPSERVHNFEEVNRGFTPELAKLEAMRCLQCADPRCVHGCPVGIHISEFIRCVAEGKFKEAAEIVKQDNALPAICGRVCPQETQCESACVLAKTGRPVAIGHLERFVADSQRKNGTSKSVSRANATGRKIAVVGSGPAGLACASDLVRMGHDVTVFEALHEVGGVLVYGIPEFRLPKEIVRTEIRGLRELGVTFVTNAVIGKIATLDDLLNAQGFGAVFIGVGAGLPRFLDVPGEDLIGVYSANEFLTRVNLMKAYRPDSETPVMDVRGKAVVTFGGGNTAMDAARTALRLGASRSSIIYRRSEKEMPARAEEITHAREEGVKVEVLTAPVEFIGDAEGWLTGVKLQRMTLAEADESGRRRPVPLPESEHVIDIDLAVIAIGTKPNILLRRMTPQLSFSPRGTIVVDVDTGRTSKRGVFAGGDIVTGGATVILAMGAGRRAASSIDEYLRTGVWDSAERDRERIPSSLLTPGTRGGEARRHGAASIV